MSNDVKRVIKSGAYLEGGLLLVSFRGEIVFYYINVKNYAKIGTLELYPPALPFSNF